MPRSLVFAGLRSECLGSPIWRPQAGRNCIPSASSTHDQWANPPLPPRRADSAATGGDVLFPHPMPTNGTSALSWQPRSWIRIGDAVSVADEVQGFRYFEDRDLIGFVDGTENPRGALALASALVGEEDAPFAGGSYVPGAEIPARYEGVECPVH